MEKSRDSGIMLGWAQGLCYVLGAFGGWGAWVQVVAQNLAPLMEVGGPRGAPGTDSNAW